MSDNDEMGDYEKILETAWDDVPEVQLLPLGSWRLKCRGATLAKPKTAEQSPAVVFALEAVEPMEDVDDDALEALGDNYDPSGNRIFHRQWFGDTADRHAVRELLNKFGVDLSGLSISESLKAVKGKTIIGFVKTDTYKGKTSNVVSAFTADE